MEKTDEKLASLIEKLQEAGFAQAPEVIDGAIRAIHWDGLVQLGVAGGVFGLLLVSIIVLLYGLNVGKDETAGAGAAGAVLCLVISLIANLQNNPWLRTFDPEAALYQQIIKGLF